MNKIKGKPYFVWPPKLLDDPTLRDQKLQCSYHQDEGHLTENCYTHLEQLASAGHLNQYIDTSLSGKRESSTVDWRLSNPSVASAGVLNVIHNPLCSSILPSSYRSEIQKVAHLRRSFAINDLAHPTPSRSLHENSREQAISFSNSDLRDVQLPHNDPLVVTLKIGNFDVRLVINQGSFAKVMYRDLYEKLNLGESDLTNFASLVFCFLGESIVPQGKTPLPILAGPVNLQTEFIVVRASSPYNAIMGRDWLYRMKAIPSTLHQKLRFPTNERRQVVAKQCVLATIQQKGSTEEEHTGVL
jgi:hypothetical protein